jgi:hypothetical protein
MSHAAARKGLASSIKLGITHGSTKTQACVIACVYNNEWRLFNTDVHVENYSTATVCGTMECG